MHSRLVQTILISRKIKWSIQSTLILQTPCDYEHLATCVLQTPCYYGHLAIMDTLLLRTGAKSPAKTTKKCIEISPAIVDSCYYGIADTLCGSK